MPDRGTAHFATAPEPMTAAGDGWILSAMALRRRDAAMAITRPRENPSAVALAVAGTAVPGSAGCHACAGRQLQLIVTDIGNIFWTGIGGPRGRGPMEPRIPMGRDIGALWTRRRMDAPAAGALDGAGPAAWRARQRT